MERQTKQPSNTFTLANGKEAAVSITIGTLLAVKKELGYDLIQIENRSTEDVEKKISETDAEPGLIEYLLFDDYALPDLLAVVCRNSIKENGMTKEEFLDALDGKAVSEANVAFFGEYVRFFKESGRLDRAAMIQGAWELKQKARELVKENVDFENLTNDALKEVEEALKKGDFSGKTSGESPESSV